MFHIHGGEFFEGSDDDSLFGPDFIVEHDVVLVTLNYRLGIFGFLSLNTKHIRNIRKYGIERSTIGHEMDL